MCIQCMPFFFFSKSIDFLLISLGQGLKREEKKMSRDLEIYMIILFAAH